uniref:HTH CENPB-type domain-containing protein n=1 Tax=Rhodnius prolixus TaxID=13249 RepID=T1HBU1_RHOPR
MKAIVRDPAIEKMEVALPLWIEDRNQKRVPLSGPMVRVKAKYLYAHFKEPDGSCSDNLFILLRPNINYHMVYSLHSSTNGTTLVSAVQQTPFTSPFIMVQRKVKWTPSVGFSMKNDE